MGDTHASPSPGQSASAKRRRDPKKRKQQQQQKQQLIPITASMALSAGRGVQICCPRAEVVHFGIPAECFLAEPGVEWVEIANEHVRVVLHRAKTQSEVAIWTDPPDAIHDLDGGVREFQLSLPLEVPHS